MLTQPTPMMTAAEFQKWTDETRTICEQEGTSPNFLGDSLIERLSSDLYTTDSTIMSILNVLYSFEGKQAASDSQQFQATLSLIDTIVPMLQDRPFVQATICAKKGSILNQLEQSNLAAVAFEKSVTLLTQLQLEIDEKRIAAMLNLAELSLWKNNEKTKAEQLYLDILSYPWTLVENPDYFQIFRSYYLQAGKGLIECRRGDLEGLKNIFFFPAANEELLPILEKAIEDAANE